MNIKSPQYGGKTLQQLREETFKDAQALFSYALKGGTAGVYMDDNLPVYFISDQLLQESGLTYDEFMEKYHGNYIETICPEDRSSYYSNLKAAFEKGTMFDFVTRVLIDEQNSFWIRDVGKILNKEEGLFLLLRNDVSGMIQSQQELLRKASIYAEKSQELEALTANIPGGVCTISTHSDDFFVIYGNKGFYALFDYTSEQLLKEKQNKLASLIYEKDLEIVKQAVYNAQLKGNDVFEFEHRIVRRAGEVVWVLVRGSFSDPHDSSLFNCVVVDITARKKVEEEARINEKRFRIALAQTDSSIFEYDIQKHSMLHGDRSALYYGLQQYTENVPDSLVECGLIHPDTVDVFLEMYERIRCGAPTATCNIKARLTDDNYAWRRITMTTIFDESGAPVQAIGILEDIDEQVKREEVLVYQSERDPLTGIYNRRATLSRIQSALCSRYIDCIGALMIIDLDNFKYINDNYGHVFGDFVLNECTDRMRSLFRQDEIIGRIGGDEFMVFANNLPSTSVALACANRVLDTFMKSFLFQNAEAAISCSIGMAIVPNDGKTFDTLYQNADIALYEAKKRGKNTMVAYHEDMKATDVWTPYSNTKIDN